LRCSAGAVLLLASEAIKDVCREQGVGQLATSFISGAGGGVAQVAVMGPCTFLVTAAVTSKNQSEFSTVKCIKDTWSNKGFAGFYPGGSAIAFRQATNWASRAGFTEIIQQQYKSYKYNTQDVKLSNSEVAVCGLLGWLVGWLVFVVVVVVVFSI
jgi:hypothetical protein